MLYFIHVVSIESERRDFRRVFRVLSLIPVSSCALASACPLEDIFCSYLLSSSQSANVSYRPDLYCGDIGVLMK